MRIGDDVEDFFIIMSELRASSFAGGDCALETTIALEKGQMGRLKQNDFFVKFAQFRCN